MSDAAAPKPSPFPDGHYYSPIVDFDDVYARRHEIWPPKSAEMHTAGVRFDDDSHRRLLTESFPRFMPEYDYPEALDDVPDLTKFYTRNSQFSWLDSRALFVLLRTWRPRKIIEVGSGYSSLLIADVNTRWFDERISVTCIEPYPRSFLRNALPGLSRLIERPVQSVPIDTFDVLEPGDLLFIDSSHVSKTGSDVNHLYLRVLPRIKPGVHIHIHDVFLPFEYPLDWVLTEQRSWNEQYLVHAVLLFSPDFFVQFGSAYAFHAFPDLVRQALAHPRGLAFGGGSLWINRYPQPAKIE
jgi:hypothetical protein